MHIRLCDCYSCGRQEANIHLTIYKYILMSLKSVCNCIYCKVANAEHDVCVMLVFSEQQCVTSCLINITLIFILCMQKHADNASVQSFNTAYSSQNSVTYEIVLKKIVSEGLKYCWLICYWLNICHGSQ